jgi:tetratricopeptide (TPR) repeat protein
MTYSSSTDGPLAVSSSHDEWEEAGRTLFLNKRYAHAVQCFQKARLTREEDIAKAYLLREQAHTAASSDQPEHFTDAATAFMKCASQTTAERRLYLRIAAECYEECGDVSEAANQYIQAEEFDRAALLCLNNGIWARAMQVVREKKDGMKEDVVNHIIHECRMHYLDNEELLYVFRFPFLIIFHTTHLPLIAKPGSCSLRMTRP